MPLFKNEGQGASGPQGATGPLGATGATGAGSTGATGSTGPGPGNAESINTVASSGTSQTIPDPATASINNITLTGNCTFTFPTAVAGKSFTLLLTQDGVGGRTVTWPAVTWMGTFGLAPVLSTAASKKELLSFVCIDGSTWLGMYAGSN